MTCYYVKPQMQDTSEQCFSCTKFISKKIHAALKAWTGTQSSSMLDQTIKAQIPNLGSISVSSRTPIIPQSYESYRVVNFLIYLEKNEQYDRKKETGAPDLHTPTVCPCYSISRNMSNRNPYLCLFKDMYQNVQRSITQNNPKVEILPIPSMAE